MSVQIKETAGWLKSRLDNLPETAIILGSGLGNLAHCIDNKKEIPYRDIPHFPVSTVEGHAGKLISGTI